MKSITLAILFLISSSALANSQPLNHQCFVLKSVQVFNAETGKSQNFIGATEKFDVTKAPHEDAYEVSIFNEKDKSSMGIAKVDTGTLLRTDEGDLIQAHAYVEVDGKQEYLGLMASTESPMARSHRFFTLESGKDLVMISFNLQCGTKK